MDFDSIPDHGVAIDGGVQVGIELNLAVAQYMSLSFNGRVPEAAVEAATALRAAQSIYEIPHGSRATSLAAQLRAVRSQIEAMVGSDGLVDRVRLGMLRALDPYHRKNQDLLIVLGSMAGGLLDCADGDPSVLELSGAEAEFCRACVVLTWLASTSRNLPPARPDVLADELRHRRLQVGTTPTMDPDILVAVHRVARRFQWREALYVLDTWAAGPAPAVAAGWHSDPHQRAELRYWDGASWTSWISNGGAVTRE